MINFSPKLQFFCQFAKKNGNKVRNELDNIFKRLYRVESSRNMKTGGHGLGLYIARELAHQLGGDIFVKSEYGQGSSFSLVVDL